MFNQQVSPGMCWKLCDKVLQGVRIEISSAKQSKLHEKIYYGQRRESCVELMENIHSTKTHVHMHPVKQRFDVLNHLKATDGSKSLPPRAFDHSGKYKIFLLFVPHNRSTYISCGGSA